MPTQRNHDDDQLLANSPFQPTNKNKHDPTLRQGSDGTVMIWLFQPLPVSTASNTGKSIFDSSDRGLDKEESKVFRMKSEALLVACRHDMIHLIRKSLHSGGYMQTSDPRT